jgi:hypothetical protein
MEKVKQVELSLHTIYQTSEDVVAREIEGRSSHSPGRRIGTWRTLYTLNETGKMIWDRLDAGTLWPQSPPPGR